MTENYICPWCRDDSQSCSSCDEGDAELQAAVSLVIDDLTESNAHTIAALLESNYRTGYDEQKVMRAYKAAQWELFGTR